MKKTFFYKGLGTWEKADRWKENGNKTPKKPPKKRQWSINQDTPKCHLIQASSQMRLIKYLHERMFSKIHLEYNQKRPNLFSECLYPTWASLAKLDIIELPCQITG